MMASSVVFWSPYKSWIQLGMTSGGLHRVFILSIIKTLSKILQAGTHRDVDKVFLNEHLVCGLHSKQDIVINTFRTYYEVVIIQYCYGYYL